MKQTDIISIKPTDLAALPRETIRYDADRRTWIVLDMSGPQPTSTGETIERAVLLDVEFTHMSKTEAGSGCGPSRRSVVGFATGKILRNKVGNNIDEWTQFNFNGNTGDFTCAVSGSILTTVAAIRVMPDRKAVYIPTSAIEA